MMSSLLHVSFVPFIYRTSAPLRVYRCNHRQYSTVYGAIRGEVCTSVLFHSLKRFIQYKVSKGKGTTSTTSLTQGSFTIVSADNIDFTDEVSDEDLV